MKEKADTKNAGFEQAAARLKEILAVLENEATPLEQSLSLYEEALALSKECLTAIRAYKGRLTVLNKEFSKLVETDMELPGEDADD
ncbi:MAG: exodeoxyribonuclease VII small subunit [Firmicutes bacterium]|nr:exodeoxyribonuclease VII small subunit [Bacillota bacterium]